MSCSTGCVYGRIRNMVESDTEMTRTMPKQMLTVTQTHRERGKRADNCIVQTAAQQQLLTSSQRPAESFAWLERTPLLGLL